MSDLAGQEHEPEPEVLTGELELVGEVRALEPARAGGLLPTAQAAASAAAGFVVGAATLALAQRYVARRGRLPGTLPAAQAPRSIDGRPVVASRSYLVDVHLLGRRPQ